MSISKEVFLKRYFGKKAGVYDIIMYWRPHIGNAGVGQQFRKMRKKRNPHNFAHVAKVLPRCGRVFVLRIAVSGNSGYK